MRREAALVLVELVLESRDGDRGGLDAPGLRVVERVAQVEHDLWGRTQGGATQWACVRVSRCYRGAKATDRRHTRTS